MKPSECTASLANMYPSVVRPAVATSVPPERFSGGRVRFEDTAPDTGHKHSS